MNKKVRDLTLRLPGRGAIQVEGAANAKALGRSMSQVYSRTSSGQCGFTGVTEREIGHKWGQDVNRASVCRLGFYSG